MARAAVLIGNDTYGDPKLRRLAAPTNDVRRLAALLRDPVVCAFDAVEELVNRPLADLRRAVFRLFDKRSKDDLLLLFFSGHGVVDAYGQLFLAVPETDWNELPVTALPAADIRDWMNRSRSRRQVIVLDCCHSGAFLRGQRAALGGPALNGETFPVSGYGREVLTATDATSFAFEGDELRAESGAPLLGKFTHFLVEGLRSGRAAPDKETISVGDLFEFAQRETRAADPRMNPQYWREEGTAPLVIAQNPHRQIALPDALLRALDDTDHYRRLGAVGELEKLAADPVSRYQRTALAELVRREKSERDRFVHARIRSALAKVGPPTAKETVERPQPRSAVKEPAMPAPAQSANAAPDKGAKPPPPAPPPNQASFGKVVQYVLMGIGAFVVLMIVVALAG